MQGISFIRIVVIVEVSKYDNIAIRFKVLFYKRVLLSSQTHKEACLRYCFKKRVFVYFLETFKILFYTSIRGIWNPLQNKFLFVLSELRENVHAIYWRGKYTVLFTQYTEGKKDTLNLRFLVRTWMSSTALWVCLHKYLFCIPLR